MWWESQSSEFPAVAGVFGSEIFGCRYESYCLIGKFYGFLVICFNFDYPLVSGYDKKDIFQIDEGFISAS